MEVSRFFLKNYWREFMDEVVLSNELLLLFWELCCYYLLSNIIIVNW
jgi:hypothetical protein